MGIYISRLKLRSFKSFKHADIQFSQGYVCLAGPNGSGKSNICDAIRFSLGEMSLKSLRVKKVRNLIHDSSSRAEVVLEFSGDEGLEAKRGIQDDGKVMYKLNGKRGTRTALLEALSPYGFEASTHNIIAQGQIQHIIEMGPKERRQIIDSVSGVMEFERKKEEALGELEKVEHKISDTKIVLAEREGFLKELEKEKNDALSHIEASGTLKRSKATLVGLELDRISGEHERALGELEKQEGARTDAERKIKELDERIRKLEAEKSEYVQKINKRSEREGAIREIEGLKGKIAAALAAVSEKEISVQRLEKDLGELEGEEKIIRENLSEIEKRVKKGREEAGGKEKEIEKLKGKTGKLEAASGKKALERAQGKWNELAQRKAKAEAEAGSVSDMLAFRKEEEGRLGGKEGVVSEAEKLISSKDGLEKDLARIEREISGLFDEEKKLNREIPDLDKRRLELAEKAATLRASAKVGTGEGGAVALISEMKKKIPGIHGTVSDLVSFDSDYAVAVEASCAGRLNYVVVESLDVASQAIEVLKRQKAGRCTFIPLDRQLGSVSSESEKLAKSSNSLGFLSEFVKYDRRFEPAMNYVFSDTILVNSIEDAKKLGFQKGRFVTLQGDLLERSGIITGGSFGKLAGARVQLEKVEAEVSKVKEERDALYSRLYEVREEMGKKRKEKATLEVEEKGIEIKIAAIREREKGVLEEKKAREEIGKKILELEGELGRKKKELEGIEKEISSCGKELEELKFKAAEEEGKAQALLEGEQKRLHEFVAAHSSLLEMCNGLENEAGLHRKRLEEVLEGIGTTGKEAGVEKKEITRLQKEAEEAKKGMEGKEEELREASKQVQKWFDASRKLEEEISGIAQEKGKLAHGNEGLARKLEDLRVKKATLETRLIDLKAEFEEYKGLERIDAGKERLLEMSRESEAVLLRLGSVNLKAPELYEEKRKDIEGVKGKISKLSEEREAVLQMISEIEKRKLAVFMEAYTEISSNFKRLYSEIFSEGEALLVLENPQDPFSGGLSMKVKSGKHEKHIESMSGGEKSLMAVVFVFAIQLCRPAPFYVLDEVDAALDKENSKKLASLVSSMAKKTQFIVVTHNDAMLSGADTAIGVTMTEDGSKVIGLQLKNIARGKEERKG